MTAATHPAMNPLHISIQTEDFDVSAELAALRQGDKRVGAVWIA